DERDEHDDDEQRDEPRGRRGRSRRGRRGGAARDQQDRQDRQADRRSQDDDSDASEPEPITEPQKLHGSTRLAAKRQRRREGRDSGRRRTVVTESEFQARREAVDRKMLVRAKSNRVQIGVLEDNVLVEHYVARNEESSLIGNVYLGRVQNVLPSMEAAFVDIGRARNAVLYSGEVDWAAAEMGANTPRKIENALKPGDKVLVQVTKDPVGHKGARLTSQVSLPGRYLVYVPGNSMNGISRKLPDTERNRLKKILKEVLPPGVGVIVRTAAEGATKEQLQRDVERLTQQWADIQQKAKGGKAPQTLHAEPDMLIKIIRDVFNEDFEKLIIQGQSEYDTIRHYLGGVAPDLLERVERHTGESDLFADYRVDEMIDKALARKVWLPSGGSLVIDRTEAMTVVDVNTGKFVGSGGNLEETVTKNNLEAAEEVVRQLRLRDIGGIIVIDFIDMVLESNRDLVSRRLVECLSRDRTKHQVAEVTSLGLVQMTRKKIGLGLLETFSEQCESCDGRGVHIHSEPVQHSSGGGRSGRSRRGRGNQQDNQQQGRQQQSKPQQSKPANGNGNGTHEITDDARNALTKIAASTIAGAVKGDGESPAIEGAAERLAIAAAAAAAGKSGEQVVAAVERAEQSGEQDASGRDGDSRDGDEGGSRRSRRGRRGRGRNRGDSQGDSGQQEAQGRRDDSGQQGGARDGGQDAGERSRDRRDDDRDGAERASVRLDLPAPKPERERAASASAPSASLGDLDAALDSLAGGRGDDEPRTDGEARREPAKAPADEPAPAKAAAPEQEPAPAQERAGGRRTRGQRRRVTTGPITASESE
ncbi:MAG: Rne/Rng family ribonuclease, partial [Microbacteriaceae bacterium]|nr:Rne/Rng family ribonuclease [Microbacteriaceae bacterium]